ncbi:MAG TPA: pyridoxal phosphate-dependent aminotransferase, partial [Oscillatoriaceae cyanobacterium]
ALASLLESGDRAIVQHPIYPQLPLAAAALGADVTPWDGRLDSLEPLLDARVRLVILNSPHNPTGVVTPHATLAAIAARLAELPRAHLLVDEVYRDIGGPSSVSAAGLPRTLVTGSVSKSWALPGLRVGWLVGPQDVIEQATRWREHTVLANAGPGEALVTALWPRRHELVAQNQALLRRNRGRVVAWLAAQGMDVPLPETAGCFLLPMPDDEAIAERWYAEGVLVVPGNRLGYPGTLRLGYGHRDPAALDAALAFVTRDSAILPA